MIYTIIRLVLSIVALGFIIPPINAVVTKDLQDAFFNAWWLQVGVFFVLGFVVDILEPGRLRTSTSGVLWALVTFIAFGAFIFLGSPWGIVYFGINPFGLSTDTVLLSNVGGVVFGILTAKALFVGKST